MTQTDEYSGRIRVLVIDADPDSRDYLDAYLNNAEYDVELAETGEEGLEKARQFRPTAVVLELDLPDMDGVEVCRRLKSGG